LIHRYQLRHHSCQEDVDGIQRKYAERQERALKTDLYQESNFGFLFAKLANGWLQWYSLLISNIVLERRFLGWPLSSKSVWGGAQTLRLVSSPRQACKNPTTTAVEDLTTEQHRFITAPAEIH